ncbi:MAG: hypothetical protein INR69_22235, partial [Mucilaginibacter polytrichastri]|nr:hypothetical protein [Mucilaginibacter polytrichastri]
MILKICRKILLAFLFSLSIVFVHGQSRFRTAFAIKLKDAGIGMQVPPNFWDIHPPQNPAMPYEYGIRAMRENFEVWFKVIPLNKDGSEDSTAIRNARKQVTLISEDTRYVAKSIPPETMTEFFNADFGRSFSMTLHRNHRTRNYKYGLLMVVQKSKT